MIVIATHKTRGRYRVAITDTLCLASSGMEVSSARGGTGFAENVRASETLQSLDALADREE